MAKIDACMTSKTNEWYTPESIFNKLDEEFNFDLDPCCTDSSAKCSKYFTKEDDGLSQNWGGHKVFMNPPYGREISQWIKKAYEESLKTNTLVVALIPARTDTIAWHEYIFNKAADVRLLKGRIKFKTIDGVLKNGAPFPSAIIVWNEKSSKKEVRGV